MRWPVRIAVTTLALSCLTTASAQQEDVTFFVIGKHANVQQDASGQQRPVDFSFFSEIFLTTGGDAAGATLGFPTGETIAYRDMRLADGGARDNVLLVSGEDRFTRYRDLQDRYPDGNYQVSFRTPSGDVEDGKLVFEERPLPTPPQVTLRQGSTHHCRLLAPGVDLEVTWQSFADGRADPNSILDDLVFVILENAEGVRVSHSGRPFEGRPYLTWADDAFTIDGDVLVAGETYTLSVEHALLDDTTRFDGVPAFTTRAVTTKLTLPVGEDGMHTCEPAMPPITDQVTMFYYKNIDEATHFYGDILGLENTLDWTWVRFFRTGPSSTVGLVTEGDGGWHKVQAKNSVMLSLVTEDVDTWYEKLNGRVDAPMLKPIGNSGPVRSFLLEDPGGYTVEFFQWLERPE
jgi:hypothetical protein